MKPRSQRRREIVETLVHHGWGYLLGSAGTGPHRSAPEHLRAALEDLGPTFIKLGQLLSTRADLLPPQYTAELAQLQDGVAELPGSEVWDVIAAELGDATDGAFASFDLKPLAAGSIGQTHGATLPDGTKVVVKVRRPGVVELVEQDLGILRDLAVRAVHHSEQAALLDLVALVDEFGESLRAELDYVQEGRNAERFAANLAGDPNVRIPRVFWDVTTTRVITLERMCGVKITDAAALEQAEVDRHSLAERAARLTAKMVIEDGFFHADPHPGNFFVQEGGRLALIDFGLVGTIDARLRFQLARLLIGLIRRDADHVVSSLLALTAPAGHVDRARLSADVARLLRQYSSLPLSDIPFSTAAGQVIEIVRRHRLRARREFALLTKTFIMDEGLASQIDPDFRLLQTLTPYAQRLMAARFSPGSIVRWFDHGWAALSDLATETPDYMRRLLELIEQGGPELHLRADELKPLVKRLERAANRVAISLIVAALITRVGRQAP